MKYRNSQASLGFYFSPLKIRKAISLEQMESVVSWSRLVNLIAPHYPLSRTGRHPFELETMLRNHFLQQLINFPDPAIKEAFFDTPLYREYVGFLVNVRRTDVGTILRYCYRHEKHALSVQILAEVNTILLESDLMLKKGSHIDATLLAAHSSTKNKVNACDIEMHSSPKGKQWYFAMKAYIGVVEDSGMGHTVRCTSGNERDVTQKQRLLHAHEKSVCADAGYQRC